MLAGESATTMPRRPGGWSSAYSIASLPPHDCPTTAYRRLEMASVAPTRRDPLGQLGPDRALVEAVRAPRLEPATRRRAQSRGRRARDRNEAPSARPIDARDGVEESPCVRMLRLTED